MGPTYKAILFIVVIVILALLIAIVSDKVAGSVSSSSITNTTTVTTYKEAVDWVCKVGKARDIVSHSITPIIVNDKITMVTAYSYTNVLETVQIVGYRVLVVYK